MRLFNTLTGSTEAFAAGETVRLYVCGVTPYDTTHLGHARTYLVFDVLVRHLRAQGNRVRYVQNVTDVDDSILNRATETGEDPRALAERFTRIYFDDCDALGMVRADEYPKATEHIAQMQAFVERLVATGHAYRCSGDVFFRVAASPGFGELSRLTRERMLEIEAEQDGTTIDDPRKEDPLDLLLWRSASGDLVWDGPWGPGRPGWHLECSALALEHLGSQVDIHGGGADLIFPHHEAEIAQSEAATGKRPFSRFWVHPGLVHLDGEPMSKSKGNLVLVRDLLRQHPAGAIRAYLLSAHYRTEMAHSDAALASGMALALRAGEAVSIPVADGEDPSEPDAARDRFLAALDDDLDTPRALEELGALADAVHAATEKRLPADASQHMLRRLAAHLGFGMPS